MAIRGFSLVPFPNRVLEERGCEARTAGLTPSFLEMSNVVNAEPVPPSVTIAGSLERLSGPSGDRLRLVYRLEGDLAAVAIAPEVVVPERRDRLWQTTCLECFLGLAGSARYWEVNVSPAGHWNIYQFEDYRQGMQPDLAWSALPVLVERGDGRLGVTVTLDLAGTALAGAALAVGVTAVIETVAGGVTYWALSHPGPEADFHQRDGFVIQI